MTTPPPAKQTPLKPTVYVVGLVLVAFVLTDYGAELVRLGSCELPKLFNRVPAGSECGPPDFDEAAMIGTLLSGAAGLAAVAFGAVRGELSERAALGAMGVVFLTSFFTLVVAARGDGPYVAWTHLRTPAAIWVAFFTLLILASRLNRAEGRDKFDVVSLFTLSCLIGFVLGLILQGTGPLVLDGPSGVVRWPELIVAHSAITAGGAAFASVLLGLKPIESAPRRIAPVFAIIAAAATLAALWAVLDPIPKYAIPTDGWMYQSGIAPWHVVPLAWGYLLPAIVASGIARVGATGVVPIRRAMLVALPAIPVLMAVAWTGAELRVGQMDVGRTWATLLPYGATPVVVVLSVGLARRLVAAIRLNSDQSGTSAGA
ncbi:MAG: hypothetical protein HC844_00415 [Tabrizicola sp.]|nr:hypothetical protein [Tabrizicola sp.]